LAAVQKPPFLAQKTLAFVLYSCYKIISPRGRGRSFQATYNLVFSISNSTIGEKCVCCAIAVETLQGIISFFCEGQFMPITKEQIITAMQAAARELGHTPTRAEFSRLSGIPYTTVKRHFSKYLAAVSACGLAPAASTQRIDTAEFLRDWGEVVRNVAAVPSQHEYHYEGRYAITSLITRFDGWTNVPSAFLKMVECGGLAGDWSDVLEKIRNGPIPTKSGSRWLARWRKAGRSTELNSSEKRDQPTTTGDEHVPDKNTTFAPLPPPLLGKKCVTATMLAVFIAETAPTGLQWITGACFPRRVLPDRPLLGEPIQVPGMAHAPVNEMGVMLLFGMVAAQLGIVVESVRAAFPDCLAKIEVEPGRWQYLRIEFEYESRAFQEHGHDPQQCDMIVCWKHNWKGCPPHLQVLELSRIVGLGR
jgi:hypothetical protein